MTKERKNRTLIQKLLYDCEEATLLSTKSLYISVGKWAYIKMLLHNIICPPCHKFHEKNKKLQELVEDIKDDTVSYQLSDEKLSEMEQLLHQH